MKAEGLPQSQQNVFGEPIELCCNDPLTGFFRDGHCNTGPNDLGTHTVCALMTDEFLEYLLQRVTISVRLGPSSTSRV